MSTPQLVQKAHEKISIKSMTFLSANLFFLQAICCALENAEEKTDKTDLTEGQKNLTLYNQQFNNILSNINITSDVYYLSILFVDLISSMELFFVEVVKAVLIHFPQKLGKTKFTLQEILNYSSNDDLVQKAADSYVHELMYKRPNEYLSDICNVLSISENSIQMHWPAYIEAKARRDLGVHNNWLCNQTYLRKTREVGLTPDFNEGDFLIPDKEYSGEVVKNIKLISTAIKDAVCEKYS